MLKCVFEKNRLLKLIDGKASKLLAWLVMILMPYNVITQLDFIYICLLLYGRSWFKLSIYNLYCKVVVYLLIIPIVYINVGFMERHLFKNSLTIFGSFFDKIM